MLPIRSAFRLAVEWAPPCPLAAVVSAAGAATSLVMEWEASTCLRKARRLIALRLKHSLARFWAYGMQILQLLDGRALAAAQGNIVVKIRASSPAAMADFH